MSNSFSVMSRYGVRRSVHLLHEVDGIFGMWGQSRYYNCAEDMIDYEGGPTLVVGMDFYRYGKITSVSFTRPPDLEDLNPIEFEGIRPVYITVKYSASGKRKLKEAKDDNDG